MSYEPNRPPPHLPPGHTPPPLPVGYPPPGYAPIGYAQPMVPLRPTSVTVLSVIGIVFGSIGLLCTPFLLLPYVMPQSTGGNANIFGGGPNPIIELTQTNRAYHWWTVGSSVLNIVLTLWLLIASIGALRLRPWGRTASIALATVQLVMMVVGVVAQSVWIIPLVMRTLPANDPSRPIMLASFIGGAVVGGALALTFSLAILICYRRRNVIEAFAANARP